MLAVFISLSQFTCLNTVYQEFISAGVNAYALGCADEGLRKELKKMKDSGVDIEEIQTYGGSTSLKSKISSDEVVFCQLIIEVQLPIIL